MKVQPLHFARDGRDIRFLLRDLETVLINPFLLTQALKQDEPPETLWELSLWMRRKRRCKVCRRRLRPYQEKCCSEECRRRWRGWRTNANKRRRGVPLYVDWARTVIRPLGIDAVAEQLGISIEEARLRAAADVRRGKLSAWTGTRNDQIRAVGVPCHRLKLSRRT